MSLRARLGWENSIWLLADKESFYVDFPLSPAVCNPRQTPGLPPRTVADPSSPLVLLPTFQVASPCLVFLISFSGLQSSR